VLVVCSRGTSFRERHLMQDVRNMMPHAKGDSKIDKKHELILLNEICEMRNCTKCIYFENKKRKDLYMWVSNVPRGPSVKFLVHNVHTQQELKLIGNCLKGSRPILSFDSNFDTLPHLSLLKELLIQTFSTPDKHPRSQPFIDHVFSFSHVDGRIWFRVYQIVDEDAAELEEIGPRMVLEPIRVFDGSFCGAVLYENPNFVSPNEQRRQVKKAGATTYVSRVEAKRGLRKRRAEQTQTFETDPTDDIFETEASSVVHKKKLARKR